MLDNLGKYRSYDGRALRDLLRVIRNKSNHYRELPKKIQDEVGSYPDGMYDYFARKFPGLLLHAYRFAKDNCAHEPEFRKFFFLSDDGGGGGGDTPDGGGGGGGGRIDG